MDKITAILLAAGSSRRMGSDNKLLLPFGDSTIIEATLQNLLKSNVEKVIVVLGFQEIQITNILNRYPVEIVHNEDYLSGQTSSVKCGLKSLDNTNNSVMIALGDMPTIGPEEYNLLLLTYQNIQKNRRSILRPVSPEGNPGNPVIFDSSFIKDFLDNSDKSNSRNVLIKNREYLHLYETGVTSFFHDIDNPDDYEKLISSG